MWFGTGNKVDFWLLYEFSSASLAKINTIKFDFMKFSVYAKKKKYIKNLISRFFFCPGINTQCGKVLHNAITLKIILEINSLVSSNVIFFSKKC